MATQLILLERVETLGEMGDVVSVKPGYARNYLLPQKKALRASKENIAYFEAKKAYLKGESDKLKAAAEKRAKKMEGIKVPLIRAASEAGQLFGSVTARDIATEVSNTSGEAIERGMVVLNQNFKMIGLFPVDLYLHPEVKVSVTINIARSAEEALTQAKTGRALVSEDQTGKPAAAPVAEEAALEGVLDAEGLEAEKAKKAAKEAKSTEDAEEKAKKVKKPKKAKKAAAEDTSEEAADEAESEE
jgi:large subunit ribosomal protein L9